MSEKSEDKKEEVSQVPSEPAILQVKPQEELGELLQRLRSEPASQIRLVVPERSIIAQGSIVLRLLAEVAGKLKKEISVVSDLPQIQMLAKRAGLKVEGVEAGDVDGHGFVKGRDVALAEAVAAENDQPEDQAEIPGMVVNDGFNQQQEDQETMVSEGSPTQGFGEASRGSEVDGGIWTRIKQWVGSHKVGLGVAAAFLIVAIGGFLMATYYLPRATVTLYTQERTIDRDLEVTANPNVSAVDKEELVIPATILTAEASQTKSFPATGEEEVGEKATGTVEITNKSMTEKSLPAGTALSSNGMQFVLNSAVVVPGYDIDSDGITFGKEVGTVTAAEIGPDYNLEAGAVFSVAGYPSSVMEAGNDEAFSGGSKDTITVVTESDRLQALESLSQLANDEAMKALQEKLSSGQLLLDDAASPETTSTNYSHSAGSEIEEFSLTVVATATAPVIRQEDLESLLTGAVEARVPDGYKLDASEPEIVNNVLQVEDSGILHLTSTFKAQVIPVVDTESLIQEIKGKHPSAVEEFLKGQPSLSGYDITLTPQLPGPFYRLPRIESNIEVTVEVKE